MAGAAGRDTSERLGEEAPLYREPLSLDVHGNPHIWN